MPETNYFLVWTGAYTLLQAIFQFTLTLIGILQYFCVFNFFRTYPLLIYLRILYFHNPGSCGTDINIGQSIEGIADQAFVYIPFTPHGSTRALLVNSFYLTLSVLWMIGSIILINGGRRKHFSNHIHWPWVSVTLLSCIVDALSALTYANDAFYTTTLNDMLEYVNGISSGLGNANPSTVWAALTMAILNARFGVFLLINVAVTILGIVDCSRLRTSVTSSEIGRNQQDLETSPESSSKADNGSDEARSASPNEPIPKIPRPGLSQSFRTMKDFLFGRSLSLNSLAEARNRNRVNFVREETVSDPTQAPQSFENLIAEQQRRLRGSTVDTAGAGRRSPAVLSRSLPQLHNVIEEPARGPRCTGGGKLPSQMPWSYIGGTPANRMRDQLPPDEDLPPVPLPDYTAFQSHRKASVHRAASSLSSLTQKKDYNNSKSSHPGSNLVDVLY